MGWWCNMNKYNNLKDVFFDSKFHVGRGMAAYDKSLDPTLFNALLTIDDVMNSQAAVDLIVLSDKTVDAVLGSDIASGALEKSSIARAVFGNVGLIVNVPGKLKLIAGDMKEGYFGVVPASKLITGDALASAVGISEGTSQFSDEDWLKFAWKGNVQFVAKKPIRNSISWNAINTAGCVFGTKTVTIGDATYKVRLMRAGIVDPMEAASGVSNHGSEWNRLILPIHIEAKDKSWAYPANVEADIPYWGVDFTDEDLLTKNTFGSGSYSWCQETYSSSRGSRGNLGVSYSSSLAPTNTNAIYGWRPVLELVP